MALFAIIGLCVLAVNGDSIGDDADLFTLALTLQSSTDVDIGQDAFNQMFWDSPEHILKRDCSTCGSTHQVIYYKRYTDLDSFDLYTYTYDWESTNNVLGEDFNLFSTLEDALADTNAWSYCNYDDNNIGMFRDCGPTSYVGGEWTSKTRGGDTAAFYIYTALESTTTEPSSMPTEEPTRDCDLLHIDEFLLDCSTEWDNAETTISTMENSIDTNAAGISANAADIATCTSSAATNADDIVTVSASVAANAVGISNNAAMHTNITSVEASITSLESKVAELEDMLNRLGVNSAAYAQGVNVDEVGMVDEMWNGITLTGKDLGIVVLAAINVIMIIAMVIACKRSGGRSKYKLVSVGSDMEPINA